MVRDTRCSVGICYVFSFIVWGLCPGGTIRNHLGQIFCIPLKSIVLSAVPITSSVSSKYEQSQACKGSSKASEGQSEGQSETSATTEYRALENHIETLEGTEP